MSRRAPTSTIAAKISGTLAFGLVGLLAVVAALRPVWGVDPRTPQWWLPHPGNGWYVLALGLSFAGFWTLSRRASAQSSSPRWGSRLPEVLPILAATAAVLGFSSFLPCSSGVPLLSPLTSTLMLYLGSLDADAVGSTAALCERAPLALAVARFAAVSATFVGAASLVLAVSRNHIARWRALLAREVDIVVGLDDLTLELVRTLSEDAAARRTALDPLVRSSWFRRKTKHIEVVVLQPRHDGGRIDDAPVKGAVVVHAEVDPGTLSLLLFRSRGRRLRVRNFYALTPDEGANSRIASIVQRLLDEHVDRERDSSSAEALPVPRIVIRSDDPRDARAWRLAHLDSQWFADALSTDELIARTIVAEIEHPQNEAAAQRAIVVGDSGLTVAVLERLAWRRWRQAYLEGRSGAPFSVVVIADRIELMRNEWTLLRPPSASHLDVEWIADDDWERVASIIARPSDVVVVTESSDSSRAQASRLSRLHREVRVFARAQGGVGRATSSDNGLRWFEETLLDAGRPPEDFWTLLARLQHDRWRTDDGRHASRPWNSEDRREQLPEFYREDNLRQQRTILRALTLALPGYTWRSVTSELRSEEIPEAAVVHVAKVEHQRWAALRLSLGWVGTAGVPAAVSREARIAEERERRNRYLRDWDTGELLGKGAAKAARETTETRRRRLAEIQRANIRTVWDMVYVMGQLGLGLSDGRTVFLPPAGNSRSEREPHRFARRGEVIARRLAESTEWTGPNGELFHAAAGDWWVQGESSSRSVAPDAFLETYRLIDGNRYRRIGEVTARRLSRASHLETREGASLAAAGSWIVVDDQGNRWAVPHEEFVRSYEPDD